MTPGKEGPPTLRGLKPLLEDFISDEYSSPFYELVCLHCNGVEPDHEKGCIYGDLVKFLDRLTDEALERDEKRNKNKDLIIQALRDGKYSVAEMWLECLDEEHPLPPDLDAPAPKDEGKS